MEQIDTLVIGAGAGGLGAGCWLKHEGFSFLIVDPSKALPLNLHNGVHYLHSIPELPFKNTIKKITLTEAILSHGKFFHEPNLQYALDYSEKVRDVQHPSSIMNVGKNDCAYMPDGNLNRLLIDMRNYIGVDNFRFGQWITKIDTTNKIVEISEVCGKKEYHYEHIISTVPIESMFNLIGYKDSGIDFLQNAIYVTNYQISNIVPNWMISLYIPDKEYSIYRASILNGICSVESIKELSEHEIKKIIPTILSMFEINTNSGIDSYEWKNGKIMSISIDQRQKVVNYLQDLQIYQIGRFGLWNRKLLIDSTINQAQSVVRFLKYGGWEETLNKLTI